MNEIIYIYWKDGRIEEMTPKLWEENKIYLNHNLFFWSNDPKVPDWTFKNGEWTYIGEVRSTNTVCQSCGTEIRNCIC